MRLRLTCLATTVALGACAYTTGPVFRPVAEQPGSAIVYVYRPGPAPRGPLRGGDYPGIYVNGEKKFNLTDAGYGVITLPPGQYEIRAEGELGSWPSAPVTRSIAVQAGREYFIRITRVLPPDVKPGPAAVFGKLWRTEMIHMRKDEALKELSKTRSVTEPAKCGNYIASGPTQSFPCDTIVPGR